MKRFLSLALVAATAVMFLPSCAKTGQTTASKPLTVVVGSQPETIDPTMNTAADGATYIYQVFEGLTKYDKNMNVVPGIAASMPTVSKDGLTYTYKLRTDAKWSDGKPVVASDFVYSWKRAVDPVTASQYAQQLYFVQNAQNINKEYVDKNDKPVKVKVDAKGNPVTDKNGKDIPDANGKYIYAKADGSPYTVADLGIKAVDDHTLLVTLSNPCPFFDQITAFPTLFPERQDIISAHPNDWTKNASTYIGDGPYVLKKWTDNDKIVMTKSPNYYDAKDVLNNEIDFYLMSDNNAALSKYKTGGLMIDQGLIPNDEVPSLIKSGDVKIEQNLANYYMALNVTKAPLNNLDVRKALALSFSRQYIVDKITQSGQKVAADIVPYGTLDATAGSDFRKVGGDSFDPTDAGLQANIKQAQQYLAEAGYPGGKNFPQLSIKFNDTSYHKPIAEYIAQQWKTNLGITVTLSSEEWDVFLSDRTNGNYQIARDAWVADYNDPLTFLHIFMTGDGNNDCHWSNSQFDSLMNKAKSSSSASQMMTYMHQAESVLIDQMPAIPVFYATDRLLVSKNVSGYVDSPLGSLYLMWTKVS